MDKAKLESIAQHIVDSILITSAVEKTGAKVETIEIAPGKLTIEASTVKPVEIDHIELRLKLVKTPPEKSVVLQEGYIKKGGLNEEPTGERPPPPKPYRK